jgi:hypothetical protein
MTLRELSHSAHPNDPVAVYWLWRAQRRMRTQPTNTPTSPSSPSSAPHQTYAPLSFLLLLTLAAALSFSFGRIIDIRTATTYDYRRPEEVPVFGDLGRNESFAEREGRDPPVSGTCVVEWLWSGADRTVWGFD